ncbi:DUF397 domain-containing protein [Streptomyces sp. HNM0574]|uniref:DUF397 domain-containing protein n=1 Tax=Streptomyces sp. HNM0574 TaxID=2714954 RepID=UPI00146CF853|nr:DUF397 domain-containing protein [Streptomyces sp. HNM0574]NLU70951.1 DUF397 domain-containing protein [Streptomyces sp. HNM0574]
MSEQPAWIKSSHSDGHGTCVEWAPELASDRSVPVRDSKDTSRPPLTFSVDAWRTFVNDVRISALPH